MRNLLLAAGCLAALPTLSQAQEVEELIVTATRLPAFVEDSPSVRVIGRQEIDDRQAVFAADILETVPGVSVARNGAFGGPTSVRMRGASADKTLVLIDGVPVNDPSSPSGAYDFASLDLADIERVEILSGPQGSIWGSDAIGGVIAFTTRELNGAAASFEAGSFGASRGSLAVGMSDEDRAIGVSASGFGTDGISAAANGVEDDGFSTWTAGANGRARVGPLRLDGRIRYTEASVELDGYAPPFFEFGDTSERAENRTWSGYARATGQAFGLDHSLLFSAEDIERFNFSPYEARRRDWRWTSGRGGPADMLSFIVGADRDETRATVSSGVAELGATSAFGVVRWRVSDRLSTTASLRYDDPDEYDGQATGRIAVAADLWAGFSAAASFGQGFKTPTIAQTVCDFCFDTPVPLKPERAEGWDVSLAWRSPDDRYSAEVTGYRLSVSDQIDYVIARYENIDRTLTTGMEAEAEARLTDRLSLKAAYGYTDAVDRSTGARLVRVPEHAGSASLAWLGERLRGVLTVRAESQQADLDPSTFASAPREGFVTADLAGSYAVREGVELTARVENLADEDFQETLGYAEPGRAVYVGFRLRP
jgi:vitamin B12 transporter